MQAVFKVKFDPKEIIVQKDFYPVKNTKEWYPE